MFEERRTFLLKAGETAIAPPAAALLLAATAKAVPALGASKQSPGNFILRGRRFGRRSAGGMTQWRPIRC
jgi:hypothetical protein